jgi:REP element-mobilizing transposase RayT
LAPDRKYEYRRKLPHLQSSEKSLFISFNTKNWWVLPPRARTIVLENCLAEHKKRRIFLEAVVIMPEHVHLALWINRAEDGWPHSLPAVLKTIKGRSGFQINKELARKGTVWQRESFDRIPRSEDKLEDHIEYIRQNPVRRGLVKKPEDYPWTWISPEPPT